MNRRGFLKRLFVLPVAGLFWLAVGDSDGKAREKTDWTHKVTTTGDDTGTLYVNGRAWFFGNQEDSVIKVSYWSESTNEWVAV